jgi:hypothetical protein
LTWCNSVFLTCSAAGGENIQANLAAEFGPFVVLLGKDSAGQADDGVPVREDADRVGAAPDLLV